jgi:hypothetical protein
VNDRPTQGRRGKRVTLTLVEREALITNAKQAINDFVARPENDGLVCKIKDIGTGIQAEISWPAHTQKTITAQWAVSELVESVEPLCAQAVRVLRSRVRQIAPAKEPST